LGILLVAGSVLQMLVSRRLVKGGETAVEVPGGAAQLRKAAGAGAKQAGQEA
jgi:microcompartment protein CcmL/EutN